MIQRIQSVFLLTASLLMGALFFLPLAIVVDDQGIGYEFCTQGLLFTDGRVVFASIPLLAMGVVITLLLFLSIFLYKKRMLQMRVCIFSMLLIIGMHGLFLYHSWFIRNNLVVLDMNYKMTVVFPVIALILVYLALRAIRKDELLVKSYDRIR